MTRSTLPVLAVLAATLLGASACDRRSEPAGDKATAPAAGARRLAIAVTENGFEPDDLQVARGEPVILAFERKTDKTCAKEVVIHVDDHTTIEKPLPLNQRVDVAVTFPTAGVIRFACAMDMVKGSVHVQ